MDSNFIDFDLPKSDDIPTSNDARMIKVIGVGGGGGNAVATMYEEGFRDVRFEVTNTDAVALRDNPVPLRRQLGEEGLGTGSDPEKGREIAESSITDIDKMFDDGTRMVFITAGMGGGTGTGASPVIAREARKAGMLTVAVVTLPFKFEKNRRIDKALDGLEALSANVDSLLVINNERLKRICAYNTVKDAMKLSDHTLMKSVKSIAEIINTHMRINLDFNDVKSVLKDGGIALISYGEAEGDDRVAKALKDAVNSPLLNDNDLFNAHRILISIYSPEEDEKSFTIKEMSEIDDFMENFSNEDIDMKFGIAYLPNMGDKIRITILASGFGLRSQKYMAANMQKDVGIDPGDKLTPLDRIGDMYAGTDDPYRNRCIFTFQDCDLDNDDIIQAVVDSDTRDRKPDTLNKIKRAAQKQQPINFGTTL